MPNPTIISSYAGEFAGKYLAAALLSADTLDSGTISILPNVKYKAAMKVGSFANLVRSADCDFDDSTPPNTPNTCLLYTSPSPRDRTRSRMPSSA